MAEHNSPLDPSPRKTEPSPPQGYETWLEYVVASFDAKTALIGTIFDEDSSMLRDQAEAIAWAEFNELRVRAGMTSISRRSLRGPRHIDP